MRRLLLLLCAAALTAPASASADATIVLTTAGPVPPTVTVRAGEAVHWTNEHFLTQTVTAADGLFDSGLVPAGGGYSLSLHVPGEHAYASAANPSLAGTIRVIGSRLAGADTDRARDRIPRIRFAEADPAEIAAHPLLALTASTTRILAGVGPGATVAEVNAALADIDAEIAGGLPALGMLLLSVPEETGALGRFTGLDRALRSLRASGAFAFASLSTAVMPDALPRRAETLVEDKDGNWGWDASGLSNWGLKNARFPQAWNLRESIGARGPQSVLTGVLDAGFEAHPDLGMQVLENLCPPGEPCVTRPTRADSHGNHVSGIIGARWDNPAPDEPGRSAGVSGGNPFARMVGAVPGRVDRAELFDEFVEGFYAFVAARPTGLRVINYSMGVDFDAEQWVAAHQFPTCGPGATDDDLATYVAAAKEWCTPNNDDDWLRERAHAGMASRVVAEKAAADGVLIVQSAGNESNKLCAPPLEAAPCAEPALPVRLHAGNIADFAWASRHWTSELPNPVLVVEAIRIEGTRAIYSNIGGDISAPGTEVLSAAMNDDYAVFSGTSMSAPHVTAAIGYLLEDDPSLSIDDIRAKLTEWSRPPPANPVEPARLFDWDTAPRYGLDDDADGVIEEHGEAQIGAAFPVDFDACGWSVDGAPIVTYTWLIAGETHHTSSCRFRHEFEAEGTYPVEVTFTTVDGQTRSGARNVVVEDLVVVGLGDAAVAGTGAPERDDRWQDDRCRRSSRGAAGQAARWLESAYVASTVTFLNLACAGARMRGDGDVDGGVLTPYAGFEPGDPPLPPQLDEAERVLGGRRADAVLISAGAGDLALDEIMADCVEAGNDCSTGEGAAILADRLPLLPLRFAELAGRLDALAFSQADVLIMLHADPSGGADDLDCLPGLEGDEAAWLADDVVGALNVAIADAAQLHGWIVVRPGAFEGHGVCADVPWLDDELQPTADAHTARADLLVPALRDLLASGPPDTHRSYGDAAPRLDVFTALLTNDDAATNLVDVNDPTRDGNRRVIRSIGGVDDRLDATAAPGGPRTAPDGIVDMRDFRRFRDAWLQSCLAPTREASCPDAADIRLDGPLDHHKHDLDLDGCVHLDGDPQGCRATELDYARFDFNGDRRISVQSKAFVPLRADGTPAANRREATRMTDLDLLASQWSPASAADGWGPDDLPALLRSADLEVHADALFAAGATSVRLQVRREDGAPIGSPRRVRKSEVAIMTVPLGFADGRYEVIAEGDSGDADLTARSRMLELRYGDDRRVDFVTPARMSVSPSSLPSDGTSAAAIELRLPRTGASATSPLISALGIEGVGEAFADEAESLAALPITWTLSPAGGGAQLVDAATTTDTQGRATAKLIAGTERQTYTIRASIDHGDGEITEAVAEIRVATIVIRYVWRQEIREWWEEGTTRWTTSDPPGPDCRDAEDVVVCIDDMRVEYDRDWLGLTDEGLVPVGEVLPVERTGTITGGGESFEVTENVAGGVEMFEGDPRSIPGLGQSKTTLQLSNRDTGEGGEFVYRGDWNVSDPDAYTGEQVEGMTVEEAADGLRLTGLEAVGDLPYHIAAATSNPYREVLTMPREILLVPQGAGDEIRFGPPRGQDLVFASAGDGFAPVQACGRHLKDYERPAGYMVEDQEEYLGASANRKFEYTPGDIPMPEGEGHLDAIYSFAATVAYEGEEPAEPVLPTCGGPDGPPVADFDWTTAEEAEGRVFRFRDRSTDGEDPIVSWQWEHDAPVAGLNEWFQATSTERAPTFFFPDDGSVTVRLTVTDASGATATVEKDIVLANLPPEASLDDAAGRAGEPLDYRFRIVDPGDADKRQLDVSITSTNPGWPAVEETLAAGTRVGRVTLPAGVYPLTLRVTDADGETAEAEAVVTVTAAPPPAPEPDATTYDTCEPGVVLDAEEQAFLDHLNAYRLANGLRALAASGALTRAADAHAADMAANDFLGHDGSDGSTPTDRALAAGYPEGHAVGENVADGESGLDVDFTWRASIAGHNENMLTPEWRVIGIARAEGSKWRWATSFGDFDDCAAPEPEPEPEPDPGESTLSSARTLSSSTADNTEAAALAAAAEAPFLPTTAFTISHARPRAGGNVTFTNRSDVAAVLELPGVNVPLAPGESASYAFTTLGPQVVRLRTPDSSASVARTLDVLPAPQLRLTYTGPANGAAGKPLTVSAQAADPGTATPVPGLELEFSLAGATARATTNSFGTATATLDLAAVGAGSHQLLVRFAGDGTYPAAQTDGFVFLFVNTPPVAHAGGPYAAGEGATVLLDGSRSTDADEAFGDAVASWSWDTDGDGVFDDAEGMTVEIPSPAICGGACETGRDYAVSLRVTDRRGESTVAAATVRFTSDFGIALAGGAMTVVPGGQPSHYGVTVVGSASWTHPVTLAAVGLPAGVTASFSVNPVRAPGTSVLTLTATGGAQTGGTTVTVQGTSNGVTRSTDGSLSVAFGLVPRCYGTVTGVVRDRDTGAPLAAVQVLPFAARTDASGRYTASQVELGFNNFPITYTLQPQRDGYWTSSAQAVAACGVVTHRDFEIRRKVPGRFAGTVVDELTGAPISGARVAALHGGAESFTVGADGTFAGDVGLAFDNADRTSPFRAERSDYWFEDKTLTFSAGTTAAAQYTLVRKCTGRLAGGVVYDERTSAPLAGVTVASPDFAATAVTDAQGRYTFNLDLLLSYDNAPRQYSLIIPSQSAIPPGSIVPLRQITLASCGVVVDADIPVRLPLVNTAVVEGYALDETTGAPIAGAAISGPGPQPATGQTAFTDASGYYRFEQVFVGFNAATSAVYFFRGTHPDHYLSDVVQTIFANQVNRVDVRLLRQRYAKLDATVTDAQTGAPVGGVSVGMYGVTNREGKLLLDKVGVAHRNAPLNSSATVGSEGYWPVTKSFTLRPDETTVVEYQLVRICAPARISGTVVNALTQAPIAGAFVSTGVQSATTNAAGFFELRNVATGTNNVPAPVTVTASASGFLSQSKQVTVYCGGSITVDFGSSSTGTSTIVGTVTNLDTGQPVAGAFVGGEHGGTATTDASGNYTLPNVPLGAADADREWDVTAIVPGFRQKTVTVVARSGQTVRADFGFTKAGNDRPVGDPQSFRIDEDRPTPQFTLTGSDANGDGLTYHVVLPPAHGRLTGVPPNLQYSPNSHFHGTDEFEFTVFDGQDYSEPARVSIQVDSINDRPLPQFDAVTRPAGVPARIPVSLVLANDIDFDGDPITVTAVSGSFGVSAALDGTDIVVSRSGPGDAFVTYTVTDGQLTNTATLRVTFVAMPVAPMCADASFAGTADQALTGQLACTDANGDAVTYAVAAPPAVGVLSLQPNGMFTYTPPTGFAGQTTFRFRGSDGTLTSAEATATITIAAANVAPVCGAAAYATDEDTTLASSLACADADADPLTYTLVAAPARGTLTLAPGGSFSYSPATNDHGTVTFRYRASDGDLQSAEATATIEIRPVNDSPVADDVTRATDEDTPVALGLAARDADGDPITIATGEPEHGSVANGVYTPAPNYHGPDTLTYTAGDGNGGTDTATVTITVRPVNDVPTAPDREVVTDEDTSIEITAPAEDADGDALTITRTPAAHGTLAGSTYTPHANYHGPDSFTYTATDDSGTSATGTIAITVRPVNDEPTVAPRAVQTDEDTPVAISLNGDDVDGDSLTITHTAPAHGTFDGSTYRPDADYHGPDAFTYTADDGMGRTATASVTLTVRPVNDPPVAADVNVETAEDTPLAIALTGTDVDGDSLTVTAGAPAHGTYSAGVYTPARDFEGFDSFTYTVEDGRGGIAQATVRIRVVGENDPPTVADRDLETHEGTPLPLALEGSDPDGDPLSFTWGDPEHGTYDGTTYRPEPGFVGADAFDYTAADGRGGTATARVRIAVRAVTRLSVAIVGPAAVDEGAPPATFTAVPAGVPAGESVTYTWSAGSGAVTPAGDTAGYTNDDGPRTDTVTVTVSSAGATATASTSVAVRNLPPTVEAGGPFTLPWGIALLLSGTASDPSQADTATGLARRWTFGDGAPPVVGPTATRTYELPGAQTATFTATDKDGASGSDTATIAISRRATTLTVASSSGVFGSAVVSARLADVVDAASARLAGREIKFVVGGTSLTALTDAEGVAVARPPLPLPTGAHVVTARFAGDGLYLASEGAGALVVRSTAGRATGGGLRSNAHPGRGGFNAASDGDAVHGELQWQNGRDRFHAHEITSFALGAGRHSAWIGGTGRDGRPFVAYVEDRGEPGRDDLFRLWIAGVLATPGDGRLQGGNIQMRSAQLGLDAPLVVAQ